MEMNLHIEESSKEFVDLIKNIIKQELQPLQERIEQLEKDNSAESFIAALKNICKS